MYVKPSVSLVGCVHGKDHILFLNTYVWLQFTHPFRQHDIQPLKATK